MVAILGVELEPGENLANADDPARKQRSQKLRESPPGERGSHRWGVGTGTVVPFPSARLNLQAC